MSQRTLILILFILSILLAIRFFQSFSSQTQYQGGEVIKLTATLLTEPVVKGNRQEFTLNNIQIFAPRFPQYHYGNQLVLEGRLTARETSKKSNWLLKKKQHALVMYFPHIERSSSQTLVIGGIAQMRTHVHVIIKSFLPGTEASLLAGILLGSKEGYSDRFFEALRNTGTLHVVAASGMNVSLVASFVMGVFIHVFPRRIVAALVLLSIVFYTLLASLEPSIVRAGIMGGLVFTGSVLNRALIAGWGLLLAGYIMLFFDPELIFDIGFQLSFAATGGLLFLKPLLEKCWHWFSSVDKIPVIGDSFTTTLVAQAATIPILVSNFGTVSILSIPVNTIVLWTIQPIMFLGILASLVSILPGLSLIPLLAAFPLLSFFATVVELFHRPEFLIDVEMPFLAGLGYYFLLIGLYQLLRSIQPRKVSPFEAIL